MWEPGSGTDRSPLPERVRVLAAAIVDAPEVATDPLGVEVQRSSFETRLTQVVVRPGMFPSLRAGLPVTMLGGSRE